MTGLVRHERGSRARRYLSLLLPFSLVAGNVPRGLAYSVEQSTPAPPVQPAEPTAAQLQQLVAPIALYPDELTAQIHTAATYTDQFGEWARWRPGTAPAQGPELAKEGDETT